ncbi:MAG TPA: SDR family NAD(P)-dependent oxidoreductase [Fibrobacteria bacterium]|nr:SDR family NAD(P)-dependent oxidoreductase [Fibrobacteria bacterium]
MKTDSNTVLITGGASGIGFALAEKFLQAGNTVIICGRRVEKLQEAKTRHPRLHTFLCDVADPEERVALYVRTTRDFPDLNVVVNNAGIQQRIPLRTMPAWEAMRQELAINLDAPIHLSALFIPHLEKKRDAAIVNVTSGLAFSPLANVPVYSATKAALRSFTLSLRHQLAGTSVSVVEIIPPAVDTDLGGVGLHTFGAPLNTFTDSIWEQLRQGSQEAAYGMSADASRASREQLDVMFKRMNPAA